MNERAGKGGQCHLELIREEVTPSGARFILSVQLEGVGTTPTVDFGNVGGASLMLKPPPKLSSTLIFPAILS